MTMRGRWIGLLLASGCLSGGGAAPAPAGVEGVVAPAPVSEAAVAAPASVAVSGGLDAGEVVCARALRCGTIGRSQLAECRKGPGSRLTLVWGYGEKLGIPALVEQGRLRVVPGAEQACLEFLARAPCRLDPATAPRGCDGAPGFALLAPGVAPGGTCTRWDECIGGYCSAQVGCEGVCVAMAPLGAACGSEQLCEPGTFCWEGVCRARAGVGAECGGHWQWCEDGLMCEGYQRAVDDGHERRPAVNGRCSAGKREGEGCVPPPTSSREVCGAGLYCDWGADAPVCRVPAAAGEACGTQDGCAEGLACAGLELGGYHPAGQRFAVRRRGRCTPTLDAGDTCDPRAFVSGCPAAMVCDEQARVCRSTGHAGDPCVSSWVTQPHAPDRPLRTDGCFGGHYCEVATRTCQPQLGRGQRCAPQEFGVADEPCFLGRCDASTRRCVHECK